MSTERKPPLSGKGCRRDSFPDVPPTEPVILPVPPQVWRRSNDQRSQFSDVPYRTEKTHRLPGYDCPTQRLELCAFLGLGVVALWLAVGAWRQAASFATERDQIAATLSGGGAVAVGATNFAATNLTVVPEHEPGSGGEARVRPS